jgi:hypothetical protein
MTTSQIFSHWDETHSQLWNRQPIRLEHEMHKSPAFSMDDLARLIEGYPRQHYSIVQTGVRGASRVWREGDLGNLSGREVIDAISRGELWLNLREVGSVDSRYRELVDRIALLPLIRRPQKGIRIVEFADLSLTHYNAPMLTAAAPRAARAARILWRDLTAALRRMPGGADLIRLRKMPGDLAANPIRWRCSMAQANVR